MKLHHQVMGEGPPVILTSGIGQTSSVWDSLATNLANHFTVLRWDFRGHGRSAASDDLEDYSSELAVADLMSMVEEVGASRDKPAALLGHSLGGYLSLRVAVTVPWLVRALVLIATGPGFRDEAAREKWNLFARSMALDSDVHPASRQMSLQWDGLVMESLSAILAPTLVIVGSEDRHFTASKNYLVGKMPNATGIEIPGAKHNVHLSHSDQVNAAVTDFLRSIF